MSPRDDINRRHLLALVFAAGVLALDPRSAFAKDGGSDDSGDSDSGGDSGGGSGKSGGGSDDHDDDDSGDRGDDRSGRNDRRDDDHDDDHDSARDAVRKGSAISLSKALGLLKAKQPGRVIDVKLVPYGSGFNYRFKIIGTNGKVKTVNMDAATGRIRGFLGF